MTLRISRRRLPADPGRGPHDKTPNEPKTARAVDAALQLVVDALPEPDVLRASSAEQIIAGLPWTEFSFALYETQKPIVDEISMAAMRTIREQRLQKADTIIDDLDFEIIDMNAQMLAEQQAGRLIVQLSDAMRGTIRDAIFQAVSGQLTGYDVARALARTIPLHTAWAQAVEKSRAKNVEKFLAQEMSFADATAKADRLADAYAKKLRNRRAWNISRTEIMGAQNGGKWAGWAHDVNSGLVVDDSLKEWEEGRNPCKTCAPLVGELRRWDEPFSNGMMMPPDHPSCRCTAQILPPDDDLIAEMEKQFAARAAAGAP